MMRVLPHSQRGILVADAVAPLWMAGGTSIGARQLKPMSSKLAGALFGSEAKRYGKRARVAEHLLSRCAQDVPACSIHLHFLFAVYTHGFHGKVGCLSICALVDASCAVPGMRARDGGGLPCNCRRLVCPV